MQIIIKMSNKVAIALISTMGSAMTAIILAMLHS